MLHARMGECFSYVRSATLYFVAALLLRELQIEYRMTRVAFADPAGDEQCDVRGLFAGRRADAVTPAARSGVRSRRQNLAPPVRRCQCCFALWTRADAEA